MGNVVLRVTELVTVTTLRFLTRAEFLIFFSNSRSVLNYVENLS